MDYKEYYNKFKDILKKYPRLLMIFGILIGVSITSFLGSIFIKSNNISNDHSITDNSYEIIEDNEMYINDTTVNDGTSADEYVPNYFIETEQLIEDADKNDEKIVDKIKKKIDILSAFLFDNGTIGGYTYDELSDDIKLKVNKIMLSIDKKIDEKFPDYKNEIKSTFNKIKVSATTKYLETVDKICSDDRKYLCEEAKKDFNKMKDTFKISLSLMKDIIIESKNNLIEYFEES